MKTALSLTFLFACVLAVDGVDAAGIYDEKKGSSYNHAAPDELLRLPKYCWGHYDEKRFKGPKFKINRASCGPLINHFCPGILRFNRSQNPLASKMERKQYLGMSLKNFEYTLNGLKDYPGCYIRKHVVMMQRRARLAATMAVR